MWRMKWDNYFIKAFLFCTTFFRPVKKVANFFLFCKNVYEKWKYSISKKNKKFVLRFQLLSWRTKGTGVPFNWIKCNTLNGTFKNQANTVASNSSATLIWRNNVWTQSTKRNKSCKTVLCWNIILYFSTVRSWN